MYFKNSICCIFIFIQLIVSNFHCCFLWPTDYWELVCNLKLSKDFPGIFQLLIVVWQLLCITGILSTLLSLDFWLRTWSVWANAYCILKKNEYSDFFFMRCSIKVNEINLVVSVINTSVFLHFFVYWSYEDWQTGVESLSKIVDLPLSLHYSISFCLVYLEALSVGE